MAQRITAINRKLDSCCNCTTAKITPAPKIDTTKALLPPPIPEIPKVKPPLYVPRENCRVHFSGLIMGGQFMDNYISEIYKVDQYSEYVGEGEYPNNQKAFPNAVRATFDGIAIDKGTRLIIYSGPNFTGNILLDVTGPKIINNNLHINNPAVSHCNTDVFPSELEKTYPRSARIWSKENMHSWSYGSCKIICAQ